MMSRRGTAIAARGSVAKWERPKVATAPGEPRPLSKWERRRRNEIALAKHGGDTAAAAKEVGITPSRMRRYLRASGFRERLEQAMAAAGLTYEAAMGVLKDGMEADKPVISTKTGEIIDTVPDHPTRVGAAGKLLGIMGALARAERPDPDENEADAEVALARPLTREEFFALTDAGRMRVTMEQRRVVVEPTEGMNWRERNRLGWGGEIGAGEESEIGGPGSETGDEDV